MTEPRTAISVYPVGVLSAIQSVRSSVKARRWDTARSRAMSQVRYLYGHARARDWHAIRNSFNGDVQAYSYSVAVAEKILAEQEAS